MNLQNEAAGIAAQKETFWTLICKKQIKIPSYQREYAQGRRNRRAELIRTGFVQAIQEALSELKKTLELDFLFGGNDGDRAQPVFYPVDGQQRLTMLFLFHWYIFARAGREEEMETLRNGFTYATRSSSEDFCDNLCATRALSFTPSADEQFLEKQIRNLSWCTGAMHTDPTVQSMLVVIDCIHRRFADITDVSALADTLVSSDCPIVFYALDMDLAADGIRDLYIKMNARGVLLTDFELFKADLQKKDITGERLDLMAAYLPVDTAEARVKLIGRFNNDYTNFFFNLIDDGKIVDTVVDGTEAPSEKQLFDVAMMNFINEVFRMNYFCTISRLGISQKEYRHDNDEFKKMSGKEFSKFIEKGGEPLNRRYRFNAKTKESRFGEDDGEAVRQALITSFAELLALLDCLCADFSAVEEATEPQCCFSLTALLKALAVDPQADKVLPFKESVARAALYAFLLTWGAPQTEEQRAAYRVWNRFVWKIDQNTEFKNFDEAVETLNGYRLLLSKCTACTPRAIREVLASIPISSADERADGSEVFTAVSIDTVDATMRLRMDGGKVLAAPADRQLLEEVIKAKLICADAAWEPLLADAETYFHVNGQVWFLLELSRYELKRFEKAFGLSKRFIKADKELGDIDTTLFERALLAQPDYADRDHLQYMSKYTTNTKSFVGEHFSKHLSHQFCDSSIQKERDQYEVTVALLGKMLDDDVCGEVEDWLSRYIRNNRSAVDWKEMFIRHSLIGASVSGLSFKNGFQPNAWEQCYTAVFTNAQRRTEGGELHSFALAVALKQEGLLPVYTVSQEEAYMNGGFPYRYVSVGNMDVGFINGAFYARTNGTITPLGDFDSAKAALVMSSSVSE